MHQDREGTVRFARREFVTTVEIRDIPTILIEKINPANENQFPWLAGMASNFQQYAFTGLAYEYVPTSGAAIAASDSALGQVAMAFNYDVSNPGNPWPSGTLKGVLNMNGATSCSPAAPGVCYLECDPAMSVNPVRFVQTETFSTTAMSTADFVAADFILHTSGSKSTTAFQCGQLWVTYEVVLFNPRPVTPAAPPPPELGDSLLAMWRGYQRLLKCTGPFTDEQLLVHKFELLRLEARFAQEDVIKLLQQAALRELRDNVNSTKDAKTLEADIEDMLDMAEARHLGLSKPRLVRT
jgi:hypothetical protein